MKTAERIYIPRKLNSETVSSFINSAIDVLEGEKKMKYPEVIFDFSRLHFVEPAGFVTLYNTVQFLISRGCKIYLSINTNNCSPAVKYLDDSGFFKSFEIDLDLKPRLRPTTTEIQSIKASNFRSWSSNILVPWLQRQTGNTKSSFDDLESAISEIFNNINDHAQCEGVAGGFAQYFPNDNKIRIVIADFGVGIRHTVRRFQKDVFTHSQALKWASEKNNSSGSTPKNRGVGLTHIQQCTANLNGIVAFKSGDAEMRAEKSKKTFSKAEYHYPGTYIEVILDTRNIPNIPDEEEDFEW